MKTDSIFSPLNPLESDDEEEEYLDNMKIPRKFHYCSKWKHDQDAVYWVKLEEAQDLGLRFWQTKSNAIIVYEKVPPDCIFKKIAQTTKKAIYERKRPLQPAPEVILRSRWFNEQQDESSSQKTNSIQQMQPCATGSSGRPVHSSNETRSQDESLQEDDRVEITTSIFNKIDLRIDGVPKKEILRDEKRMKNKSEVIQKLEESKVDLG